MRMFASLFVIMLPGLCYSIKDGDQTFLGNPQLSGPSEALVGNFEEFECKMPTHPMNEPILLTLIKIGTPYRWLGDYTSLAGEAGVIILRINPSLEGNLVCTARRQNSSNTEETVSQPHYLKIIVPVKGAEIDVRSGPVEFFEGQKLELLCNITKGNQVSYTWLLNGRLISQSSGLPHSDHQLLINRTTSEDSGSYICMATNHINQTVFTSNSSEVVITVKDVVSAPDISITPLKEDSQNYSAVVTCQSTKGTPPVTFSLYNGADLVANMTTDNRSAKFKVPLVMAKLKCRANNGDQSADSQWLPLEIIPVGGSVTLDYDYDIGENFAVASMRFYCKAAKGSHPRYQWFLNKTLLHGRGSFYYVVDQPPEQSILLLSVGSSSVGTYHCEVSNSFDNTTAIISKKIYVDKEVLIDLPMLVVAVVFGCFTALIVLICICCVIGLVYRQSSYKKKNLLGLEMERLEAAEESELDPTEYNEDADVVNTARGDEFDQASGASVDEWPIIAEQKPTLEDEPAEVP